MDTLDSSHAARHEAEGVLDRLARRGESLESFGRQPAKKMQGIHEDISNLVNRRLSLDFITLVLAELGITSARETVRRYLIKYMPSEYCTLYAYKMTIKAIGGEGRGESPPSSGFGQNSGQSTTHEEHAAEPNNLQGRKVKHNDVQRKYTERDINHESRHFRANPAEFFGGDGIDGFESLKTKNGKGE